MTERSTRIDFPAPGSDVGLRSFWIGGYEGADHFNGRGVAFQMGDASGHLAQVDADYARLADFGIACVCESVGWRSSEHDGGFDFRHLDARIESAHRHGIQIVWTLWHYGVPDDVDVFALDLRARFARFAAAFASYLLTRPRHGELIVNPINEISFYSWGCLRNRAVPSASRQPRERGPCNQAQLGAGGLCRFVAQPSAQATRAIARRRKHRRIRQQRPLTRFPFHPPQPHHSQVRR